MFFIHKKRNYRCIKHMSGNASIFLQISRDHSDLAVSVSVFTHQPADSPCRFFHFTFRISCLKNLHLLLFFVIGSSVITKQILFQKIQCRCFCKSGFSSGLYPDWFFHIPGKFRKGSNHFVTHIKQLMWFSFRKQLFSDIHCYCHCYMFTDLKEFPDNGMLHWRETGISIQHNCTSFQFF